MATGLRLKDKVAIVTGGCSGIGLGCVEVFVENGGMVAVFDVAYSNEHSLSILGPGKTVYIHCDVTKEEEIQKAIKRTVEEFGQIDCLVNNVGVTNSDAHMSPGLFKIFYPKVMNVEGTGSCSIGDGTIDSFRRLLEVNVVSMFTMCKYALPYLRKVKGSIVNISSFSGTHGQALLSTYCASKGAIRSFSKALAIDESKYGVRVNTVCPGPTNTPLLRNFLDSNDDKRKAVEGWAQLGRCGEPREIGLVCLYLVTDATFSTGIDLMCTGGCEIGYGVKSDF